MQDIQQLLYLDNYFTYTFGLTDLQKYWIVEMAICTVKLFAVLALVIVIYMYMHLVLLRMLGIYVHVVVITVLSFFLSHVEWKE